MPCYKPRQGFRSNSINPKTGKAKIVFQPGQGNTAQPITVPCGYCVGCQADYARQWAIRILHEAQMHKQNCFITLTYNDENLPEDWSLSKRDWQLFVKKLRDRIKPIKVRFYACGEYGEIPDPASTRLKGRPHYHAIIFGYDFVNQESLRKKTVKKYKKSSNGDGFIYQSDLLDIIWGKGFATVAPVTPGTANYTAQYCTKKVKGYKKREVEDRYCPALSLERGQPVYAQLSHYQWLDEQTGEIYDLEPEFSLMSRMPGIGRSWLDKYQASTDKDFLTNNGDTYPIPTYYDKVRAAQDPEFMEIILAKRRKAHEKLRQQGEHTQRRLDDKNFIREKRANLTKKRDID